MVFSSIHDVTNHRLTKATKIEVKESSQLENRINETEIELKAVSSWHFIYNS